MSKMDPHDKSLQYDHKLLISWYKENKRDLPWRQTRDPYSIWLSEVMLQQTTVVAVIPYFKKFLNQYPTINDLANAPLENVLESWSGLGYYSRARNLHKAAQALARQGFPKTAAELIEFPGFGPYTSRAVASIAFDEKVGVLDGNVIRVLCRRFGISGPWWESTIKNELQKLSDQLASYGNSSLVNQGLMELGAIVCTPQKTLCALCPWSQVCKAFQEGLTQKIPRPKPRKALENWIWQVDLIKSSDGSYALCQNQELPFLKGQLVFPGKAHKAKLKPQDYDVQHGITHHKIFIQINKKRTQKKSQHYLWMSPEQLKKKNPSIVLQKILKSSEEE